MSADASPDARPPVSLLLGIFFLSAAVLMLEVLESRILAYALWHHFGFMVIGIAMLGLAAGGSALAARSERFAGWLKAGYPPFALFFSAAVLMGHLLIARLPMGLNWWLLPGLIILYLLLFLPFAAGGLGLALAFRLHPAHSGQLYMVSMIGSVVGVVLFLVGLEPLGAERLLVITAILGFAADLALRWPNSNSRRIGCVAFIMVLALGLLLAPKYFPFRAFAAKPMAGYLAKTPGVKIETSGWTPYCRIDVVDLAADGFVFGRPYPAKIIFLDGDNPTLLLRGNTTDFTALAASSPYVAGFWVNPHPQKMLIIGSGGGVEAHLAVARGVPDITAVEINPLTLGLVEGKYADWTGRIYQAPAVHPVNAEGRSFLSRSQEKYDLITVNMVDTYTSLVSGAYVLSESYLYTREAMGEYLDHLSDDGVVGFFRFRMEPPRESLRLVALMVQALRARGYAPPADHLVVLEQKICFNLLVRKRPFTLAEVKSLEQSLAANSAYPLEFKFLHTIDLRETAPAVIFAGLPETPDAHSQYLAAVRAGREREFLKTYPYDLIGITDDSPYFFKYSLLPLFRSNIIPTGAIWLQIVQGAILSALLVLWPLRRLRNAVQGRGAGLWLTYFAALGFGYLLTEIAVMQKLVLFLGNPTYSLSVTLTALLASSGLGAGWMERHRDWQPGRRAAIGAAALAIVFLVLVPLVSRHALGLSLPVRVVIAVVMVAPLGFIMGMPFPAGLRAAARVHPDLPPWAFGVNNAAAVLASSLSVPLAMATNFSVVLAAAAACYLLAAVADRASAPKI